MIVREQTIEEGIPCPRLHLPTGVVLEDAHLGADAQQVGVLAEGEADVGTVGGAAVVEADIVGSMSSTLGPRLKVGDDVRFVQQGDVEIARRQNLSPWLTDAMLLRLGMVMLLQVARQIACPPILSRQTLPRMASLISSKHQPQYRRGRLDLPILPNHPLRLLILLFLPRTSSASIPISSPRPSLTQQCSMQHRPARHSYIHTRNQSA